MEPLSLFRYTLCFLTRGDEVLMLLRQKAPNRGLWNGVGGRIEVGEDPRDCILREVYEETGFRLNSARFAGLLTWEGFEIPNGGLFLFTAEAPRGEPGQCSEGTLAWKPRAWVCSSPEVVSNIHRFAPSILRQEPPQTFHFVYQSGQILQHETRPLPAELARLFADERSDRPVVAKPRVEGFPSGPARNMNA
jgi:8-oxo-dGTP diphosphatase